MAEVQGYHSIVERALPTGVDGTVIAQWELRQGYTYEQFVDEVASGLASVNEELATKIGPVGFITDEIMEEYADGGSVSEMPEITDIDQLEMMHGTTIGHMLPFKTYGTGLGASWLALRELRSSKLEASVKLAVDQARWRFNKTWMRRFFTNTENAIGSSGYDVPFVRGTGGNVDFTPGAYEGEAFASTHDHFIGADSGSKGLDDLLNELAETVEEHGHEPPFRAYVSKADVAAYKALTDFKEFIHPRTLVVDRGAESTGNQLYVSGQPMVTGGVFGYYESNYGEIELMATPRLTTGYAGLFKSYGTNDRRNPLAIRVWPGEGFGLRLVPEYSGDRQFPIKRIGIVFEFGAGVGMDRTNGAVGLLVSGGTYANPTIA